MTEEEHKGRQMGELLEELERIQAANHQAYNCVSPTIRGCYERMDAWPQSGQINSLRQGQREQQVE